MGKREKNTNSEENLKAKARKISIFEASCWSVSDGFGFRNITPYALALGANNAQIGFLTSIPSLLGNLFQMHTSKLMEYVSRKRIVLLGVMAQALMWLFMILTGIIYFVLDQKEIAPTILIIVYTLLVIFGAIPNPAWSSWMRDIINEKERGRYFAKRSKIAGFVSLSMMLLAGFILDYFKQTNIFIAFIILFFFSFIFRAFSVYLFNMQYEPILKLKKGYYFSFFDFIKRSPQSNFGKYTIFIALMSFSVAVASPFFTVYMLKDLHFSYVFWIITVISSSLMAIFSISLWGKLADKYGNLRMLKITGMFIPFIPLLWVLTPLSPNINITFLYLILCEAVSGFIWAGFNLSSGNFIYDAVTKQRVAICVSYFNILNGIGVFIGATLGGFIADIDLSSFGINIFLVLFAISGILRFAVYFAMIKKIKEVREVDHAKEIHFTKHLKQHVKTEIMDNEFTMSIHPRNILHLVNWFK